MKVNAKNETAEQMLTRVFGVKAKPVENGFKVNIKNLINDGMKQLLEFDSSHDIQVNRSGAGIVIIMTAKQKHP